MPIARTLWNQRVRTRDGIELAVDVLLPPGSGPFPTVLTRTPYGRARTITTRGPQLTNSGYALVLVDLRGRGDSDGLWRPFVKDIDDAYDIIEWIARQPWATGKIGMLGISYDALTQWWAAAGRPPHLTCIVPQAVGCVREGETFSMSTGIPIQYWLWWMTLVTGRTMQNIGAPPWEDQITSLPLRTIDERLGIATSAWQSYVGGHIDYLSVDFALSEKQIEEIDIPVLVGVGWWDDQQTLMTWRALQKAKSAKDCRLLIGPWDHPGNMQPRSMLGGLDMSAGMIDMFGYIEKFLALHLKGDVNEMTVAPRCHIFQTGTQRWEDLDEWPQRMSSESVFYLTSDGDARSLHGNGRLVHEALDVGVRGAAFDEFTYDPNNPGRDMTGQVSWFDPPLDIRYLLRRKDVLVYDTAVLSAPLSISGRARFVLFVSSDCVDTDIFTTVCDIHPDGRAVALGDPGGAGCRRLSHRDGQSPGPLRPGAVIEVHISGVWLHHVLLPGHRLRLAINANGFPFRVRNAGTGEHWADDTVLFPQTNILYHSPMHRSRLLLPTPPEENV